jgi:hypothetical protein
MINLTLSSKRIKQLPIDTQTTTTEPVKTLFKEAQRRDELIKKLAKECPYKVNDIVKPSKAEHEVEYGDNISVVKIIDSYGKFGKNETWPASDVPLIVYAFSKKAGCFFFCTTNYLKSI